MGVRPANATGRYYRGRNTQPKDSLTRADNIEELPIGTQVLSRLMRNDIFTIDDLLKKTDWDIMDIQWIGKRGLASINKALTEAGFPEITKEYPRGEGPDVTA